jgi:hypothetical protein
MNTPVGSDEKLLKLLSQYKGCQERWQNQVKAGKSLLDSILQIR